MHLSEFNNLKDYIKPGDICAIKYRERTKYINKYTGAEHWRTDPKQEIYTFKGFSGLNLEFEGGVIIYHVNLSYLKKVQSAAA